METITHPLDNREVVLGALNMAFKCRTSIGFAAPIVGWELRKAYWAWLILARQRRQNSTFTWKFLTINQ